MGKKILIALIIFFSFNISLIYAFDENQVRNLIKDGAYEEAYDIVNSGDKESFEYFYYSGLISKEELNFILARFYYEKALSIKVTPEACADYAEILLRLNEINLLGKKLDEWDNNGIRDNRISLIKAKYHRKTRNYKKALEVLDEIKEDKNLEEEVIKERILVYYETNDRDKATPYLNTIVTGQYSDTLKDFAFQYLKYFSSSGQRTTIKFSYMYGYDNNVVSEPDDKFYAALISGKDDNVHLFGFNFNHFRPYKNYSFNLNYDFGYSAYNHLSEYNYLTNNLNIEGSKDLNKNLRLSLSYNLFYSLLDERSYLIINGIQPGITFLNDSADILFSIYPFFEKREFIFRPANQYEDRDGYKYGGKIELARIWRHNYFSLGTMYARDNTQGYNWRANEYQFYCRSIIKPFENFITDVYLSYRIDDYLNSHKSFFKERFDEILDFVIVAEYLINKNFSVIGRYVYINSNSNITLYDYQRKQITIGLQVRF